MKRRLLHTGTSYPDDLSADGVLYRYPHTNRPGHDQSEIEATKQAMRLGVPVFVIAYSEAPRAREVHLGWVEDYDDDGAIFLVSVSDDPPPIFAGAESLELDAEPFVLVENATAKMANAPVRPGQQRFKFLVLKRYGSRCVVCPIAHPELLDAAHLRPKNHKGSDDPRNGLIFCALHHRAYDRGMFAFAPDNMAISYRTSGPKGEELAISSSTLGHLSLKPHPEALAWAWRRWNTE